MRCASISTLGRFDSTTQVAAQISCRAPEYLSSKTRQVRKAKNPCIEEFKTHTFTTCTFLIEEQGKLQLVLLSRTLVLKALSLKSANG